MARGDHMGYMPGMERLDSTVLEAVLAARLGVDFAAIGPAEVQQALCKSQLLPADFAALLSPAAEPFLEEIAQRAQAVTAQYFGNAIYMFTPLYIANYCENHCIYCGFNSHNQIQRARLSLADIEKELAAIAKTGLEEVLILSGESPQKSDLVYLGEACRLARKYFRVVGLEVYPMDHQDYAFLHRQGADFVTVFQETYATDVYERLHLAGRKRSFPYRFYAQERALRGGMRGVNFGALLGLDDFRRDAFATGMHAYLLQRQYPQAEIGFSCPRLRPIINNDKINPREVHADKLLQVIMAYRLFMPTAQITLSTREAATFRDHAIGLGPTKLSAGVQVGVGGHEGDAQGDEQFDIADVRSVAEVYTALRAKGFQPVMSEYVYV